MEDHVRRSVAYVAACSVSGSRRSSIYDYNAGKHSNFSGSVGARVNVYDHDAGCHISGGLPNLYHFGVGKHIQLKVNGARFSGYDFHSGDHFQGRVNGKSVAMYDHGTGQHYNYHV